MVAMTKYFARAQSVAPREEWEESLDAERTGDFTRALRVQERLNASSGLDYGGCMRVAWLHFKAGGYRRAREYYEIANLFSEGSKKPLLGALDCCIAMGDLDGASEYLDSISYRA